MDKVDKMNSVEELYEQRTIVAPYCVSKRISPYEFLILEFVGEGKTITDIQVAFGLSKLNKDGNLNWFSKTNRDQIYKIDSIKHTVKTRLATQKNLINIQGEENDIKLRKITLTDTGKHIVEEYKKFRHQKRVMQEEKFEKDKERSEALTLPKTTDVLKFNLSDLPNDLQQMFEYSSEQAYYTLCQDIIRKEDDALEVVKKYSTMPVFVNIPEAMQTNTTSTDFFRGGLNLVKGLVSGYSLQQEMNLGTILHCEKCYHKELVESLPRKMPECPMCYLELEQLTRVDLPVYKLYLELETGEKISCYIPAMLWRPQANDYGLTRKFLLMKLNTFTRKKVGSDISYLIVGTEELSDDDVDMDRAESIARNTTDRILSGISNSLFPDIRESEIVKELSTIAMGSLNTEKISLYNNLSQPPIKETRGTMNVLLWGEPGTGKSDMSRRLVKCVSKYMAVGQSGNTSAAGWTAAYDSKQGFVTPGILPMNNGKAVVVDELDKFDDFGFLLEPMEEKKFEYSKAGQRTVYDTNVVMLMTANNVQPIGNNPLEQMVLEFASSKNKRHPIIERFDTLVPIPKPVSSAGMFTDFLKQTNTNKFLIEDIENYFKAIRTITEVTVPPEVLRELDGEIASLKIKELNYRQRYSIVRYIAAITKLHLRDEVSIQDMKEGIKYYEKMYSNLMGDLKQERESFEALTIKATDKTSQVLKLIEDETNGLTVMDIMSLSKGKLTQDDVEIALGRLKTDGTIFESKHGLWRYNK